MTSQPNADLSTEFPVKYCQTGLLSEYIFTCIKDTAILLNYNYLQQEQDTNG